jgi:hypothetical protein
MIVVSSIGTRSSPLKVQKRGFCSASLVPECRTRRTWYVRKPLKHRDFLCAILEEGQGEVQVRRLRHRRSNEGKSGSAGPILPVADTAPVALQCGHARPDPPRGAPGYDRSDNSSGTPRSNPWSSGSRPETWDAIRTQHRTVDADETWRGIHSRRERRCPSRQRRTRPSGSHGNRCRIRLRHQPG